MLRLSDTAAGGQPAFPVVELELDGSTLKTLNFAQSVAGTFDQSPETTPQSWALPALRSAGLALAHTGQALDFGETMSNLDSMNAAVAAKTPISLAAEDVTRGFRIDVWDGRTNKWHQLCAAECGAVAGPGRLRNRQGAPHRSHPGAGRRRGLGRAQRRRRPSGRGQRLLPARDPAPLGQLESRRPPGRQAPVGQAGRRAPAGSEQPPGDRLPSPSGLRGHPRHPARPALRPLLPLPRPGGRPRRQQRRLLQRSDHLLVQLRGPSRCGTAVSSRS